MHVRVENGFTHHRLSDVQRCKRVIHLCTGDRAIDGAIAGWLDRHGVDVVACADPYEACAFALTQPDPMPDLAFIGADWLAPDETAIIHYFRQVWPGLALVIYGSTPATSAFQDSMLTFVCRSASALRRVLEDHPDHLLERFPDASRPRAAHDGGLRQSTGFAGNPVGEEQTPSTLPAPPGLGPDSLAVELNSPSEILTPEELAALLDDDGK
jgi:hypothetical protein